MSYRYLILGAGRQGTAAAYDLAVHGDAASIVLADSILARARAAAARVNELAHSGVAEGIQADVCDADSLPALLAGYDVCLSAVPYYFNPPIARAAIEARCSLCDLGGNTAIVWEELALDAQARGAGVSIVPDCGVGPGMISNLAVYAMEQLDEPRDVVIYDGGLPINPRPPLDYVLFFSIEGLTNEYAGEALYIIDGQVKPTPSLAESEFEMVEVPGFGLLEAIATAGGLSTMVSTFDGKLRTLKNKTLRYPAHYSLLKAWSELGLFELEPIKVGDVEVVPRQVLHALLGPRIAPQPGDRDLMIIHILASGNKGGREAAVTVDLVDRFDEETGFSAMERTTGFHLAIVAGMIARGEVPRGAVALEMAVSARAMVEELARRGMNVEMSIA